MSSTIGDLVDRAAKARRWGDQRLAFEIGVLPSEKIFNATQVKRLRRGERQNLSRELVARLIDVLDLDEDEAWHAAGLWPPALDLAGYRRLKELAARSGLQLTARYDARLPVDPAIPSLVDRLRRGRPPTHELEEVAA